MDLTNSILISADSENEQTLSRDIDFAIIEKVKQGDISAFDILTKKYRERLFSVVYNITSNREDAFDITQDAFIKAFSSINSFKGKSAFYTWLYRIAVNMAVSFVKKNRFRRFFSFENINEEAASSEILDKLSAFNGGDRATNLKELQEKLNEALQTLSIEHRTVVILFEIEGLSHQEIAEITKVNIATVRSRLHYAKRQLQTILKDYVS